MTRKKAVTTTARSEVAQSTMPGGLLNDAPVSYPVADTAVQALQVYLNPERRPTESGPWDGEADKVGWVDAETGFGCIMLRQANGTLSGYVGVGPEHPLFGFSLDALPVALAASVHGGITYARACEVNRFAREADGKPRAERYTVCHVTRVRMVQDYRTVQTTKDEFGHEDLWWLGFDTDHPGDLVPKGYRASRRRDDVYRDQAFVYAHCIELARRMMAASGKAPREAEAATSPPRLPPPLAGGEGSRS